MGLALCLVTFSMAFLLQFSYGLYLKGFKQFQFWGGHFAVYEFPLCFRCLQTGLVGSSCAERSSGRFKPVIGFWPASCLRSVPVPPSNQLQQLAHSVQHELCAHGHDVGHLDASGMFDGSEESWLSELFSSSYPREWRACRSHANVRCALCREGPWPQRNVTLAR